MAAPLEDWQKHLQYNRSYASLAHIALNHVTISMSRVDTCDLSPRAPLQVCDFFRRMATLA